MSKRTNTGFTLIELVIVLVLLGILAAVAAPRFLDLSTEAEEASLEAQASALGSGSAINFAKWAANNKTVEGDIETIEKCNDLTAVADNFDDDSYSIGDTNITKGDTEDCTLTQESTGETSTFVGHGVE
ncbi:MAG: type II secretion system protein [Spiribacter salinus]|uniref:Type II secretion system protein n=1 Tax=Spiribacter salinus TaxID=1335746 RepID=A0A540VD06_9GAMM|nr:MAG: type II secretion system protein [Spiribacter salinus]